MRIYKRYIPKEQDVSFELNNRYQEVLLLKAENQILYLRYSDDQPRDEHGRWTSDGGAGLTGGENSGIIRLRINLFDTSDPLYYESFSIEEEPGFEDICGHGSPSAMEAVVNGKKVQMNAHEFAEHLRSKGYKGGDIRLASCSTGKGENSFAQQLSAELGVRVKAPDGDVYYIPDEGILLIGSQYANIGKWRTFNKGVEVID